jgi:replicative DNA helicase
MSDQNAIQLAVGTESVQLASALGNLQNTLFEAAEANIRAALGEEANQYSALQMRAMTYAEALRLTSGMDLSTIITRGNIIRDIETQGLTGVHPNGYANLTALAAENGVSVGELSDIRALCDVIFPYIAETLQMNLMEVWDRIGKSSFREMVPALRSLITGEQPNHASVRQAVEQMLNGAAIALADVEECEPADVPETDVRRQAVVALLNEATVHTTREMRRRVRPSPVPHVQMATLEIAEGQWYGLLKFDSQEQLDLVLRILNPHIDNMRLSGRGLSSDASTSWGPSSEVTVNNPRWEKCLIGSVIGYPTEMNSVTDVQPDDMAYASHQNIWQVVLDMERTGSLSYQAVVEKLRANHQLENIGRDVDDGDITGELYIQELLSLRAQPSIQEFGRQVIDASTKRQLKRLAQLTSLDAESEQEADDLLDHVEQQIYSLRRSRVDTGVDVSNVLDRFMTNLDEWRAGTIVPAYTFSTPGLERIIPFLEPTDFMLIAGRPSEGKSSLLRSEAFGAALKGKKVVIFNMENDDLEYARYLIAHVSGIDTFKLRKPTEMTDDEIARSKAAAVKLKKLMGTNLKIVSLGAPTVHEIIRIARKLVTTEGFRTVFVDYIQLIQNGIENEVQDLSMTSSLLRGFALKYRTPVIAAAQLNREIARRAVGSEPQLSDLRGSGSLEQDAVIIAFTGLSSMTDQEIRQLEQNRNPDGTYTVRAVKGRLYVKKNRNGPIDRTPEYLWEKHVNRFTAIHQTVAPRQRQTRPANATQQELHA